MHCVPISLHNKLILMIYPIGHIIILYFKHMETLRTLPKAM